MSGGGTIAAPGIYSMTAQEYHKDPCPIPSLSNSIARLLVRRSPLHAHYAHPRLGAGEVEDATQTMDAGSAVHSMVLGVGAPLVPLKTVYPPKHKKYAGLPVRDFKTAAAEEEREAIREEGGIPVLMHKLPEYQKCARAVRMQMAENPDCAAFLEPGQSEAVVIWQEGDLWFRAMVDRLPDNPRASPYDLKLTEMSAAPGGWEKRLQTIYAFQAAFYERGLRAVRGVQPGPMRFCVGELDAPYGFACMSCAPKLQAMAEAEVDRAIRIWAHCTKTDQWPGYSPYTAYVDAPNWMLAEAEARALRDEYEEANDAI